MALTHGHEEVALLAAPGDHCPARGARGGDEGCHVHQRERLTAEQRPVGVGPLREDHLDETALRDAARVKLLAEGVVVVAVQTVLRGSRRAWPPSEGCIE